jgi:hypothetical protein
LVCVQFFFKSKDTSYTQLRLTLKTSF